MANTVSITDLRWEYRVIVAFSAEGSLDVNELRHWVDTNRCRLKERDVIVFSINSQDNQEITGTSFVLEIASVQALNQRRQHSHEPLELLLIGKDGGLKASSSNLKELDNFIALIDTMPMRKQEAARNKPMC